jgi:hypothetical protein
MNIGTFSSTEAAQMTFVPPTSISADPSACGKKFGVIFVWRIWSNARPSVLV